MSLAGRSNCRYTLRHWHARLAPQPAECGAEATLEELREENKRLRRELRPAEPIDERHGSVGKEAVRREKRAVPSPPSGESPHKRVDCQSIAHVSQEIQRRRNGNRQKLASI